MLRSAFALEQVGWEVSCKHTSPPRSCSSLSVWHQPWWSLCGTQSGQQLATSIPQPPVRDPSSGWTGTGLHCLLGSVGTRWQLQPPHSFCPPTVLGKGTSALSSMLQVDIFGDVRISWTFLLSFQYVPPRLVSLLCSFPKSSHPKQQLLNSYSV